MNKLALCLLATVAACATDDAEPLDETAAPADVPPLPTEDDLARIASEDVPDDAPDRSDPAPYAAIQVEGESMSNLSGSSGVYNSPYAVYGRGQIRLMFANGDIGAWIYQSQSGWRGISVAAQGSWCTRGWPGMQVWLYDHARGQWYWASGVTSVDSKFAYDGARYFPYHMGTTWMNAGWNFVLVRMSNDSYSSGYCDANLAVDYASVY